MKMRTVLLASAIGLFMSVAAQAEPPTGSRLGERMKKNPGDSEEVSARHGHEFASCLVNRRRTRAEALLAAKTEADLSAAHKSLFAGQIDCYSMWDDASIISEGRSFNMPNEVLRGMLAEELIKRDLPRFSSLAPLPRQLTYPRDWYAGTSRHVAVNEMAVCVGETAPAESLALVRSEPYSNAERAAFAALGPHLGACLQAGTKVDANRQTLRAALADALYMRVASPAPAAATPALVNAKAQ